MLAIFNNCNIIFSHLIFLSSLSFQTMDYVFKNDNPDFLVSKATTVEKLGHAMHMHEIWSRARIEYNRYSLSFLARQHLTDIGLKLVLPKNHLSNLSFIQQCFVNFLQLFVFILVPNKATVLIFFFITFYFSLPTGHRVNKVLLAKRCCTLNKKITQTSKKTCHTKWKLTEIGCTIK